MQGGASWSASNVHVIYKELQIQPTRYVEVAKYQMHKNLEYKTHC